MDWFFIIFFIAVFCGIVGVYFSITNSKSRANANNFTPRKVNVEPYKPVVREPVQPEKTVQPQITEPIRRVTTQTFTPAPQVKRTIRPPSSRRRSDGELDTSMLDDVFDSWGAPMRSFESRPAYRDPEPERSYSAPVSTPSYSRSRCDDDDNRNYSSGGGSSSSSGGSYSGDSDSGGSCSSTD